MHSVIVYFVRVCTCLFCELKKIPPLFVTLILALTHIGTFLSVCFIPCLSFIIIVIDSCRFKRYSHSNFRSVMSQTGISTHNQVEIAFLWRTFSLLQYFDDDDIFLEYFNEFLPHILKLRPLSLADEEFLHNSDPNDSTKKKYSFLSLRELQYLKSIDENSPSTPHFVAPLFEAFEAQYINGGRYEALMICLALAVKSGRSCLLVRCAVHLMKVTGSKSFNSLILTDLVEHVKATCPKTSLGSLFYGDEDFLAHKSLNVASSDDLLSTDMDEDKLRPPPVHAVLTFGKADHGKLGHPDTQVFFISCLLLYIYVYR